MKKIILLLLIGLLLISPIMAQGISKETVQRANVKINTTSAIENQQQNISLRAAPQNLERVQARVRAGNYVVNGTQVQIQEQANKKLRLRVRNALAHTDMNLTQEQTQQGARLRAVLSNGKNARIKIMPDAASERAIERLRVRVCSAENNCTIELKEVGAGEEVKAAYEVRARKRAKILGLFETEMPVQAQVNAENGEIIRTKKPWWAFLASETEE